MVFLVPLSIAAKPPLSVSDDWLGPVCDLFQEIQDYLLNDPSLNLDKLSDKIDQLPGLFTEMDHDAFAETLERALGAAAISGAIRSLRKVSGLRSKVSGLSALAADPLVPFLPWEQAAAGLEQKTAIRAKLDSREWRKVPQELRERAFFSARVESARFLSEARGRLAAELRLQREELANGKRAFFSRDDFISEMRKVAEEEGISTDNGEFSGGIRDIRSPKRLGLVYDTQTQMGEEYTRYKMDLDPDVLDAFPAKRLVRVEERKEKRHWDTIWQNAAGEVNGEGVAARQHGMVALKTSPIWAHLGPFENPYPPYDYGSGMGDEDVSREDAAAMGLVPARGDLPPAAGFNANLQASAADLDSETKRFLVDSFGDQVTADGDTISWNASASLPAPSRWSGGQAGEASNP